jgi:hypothetical protein
VRSAALLLLVVFALKAALVPLYFWLPAAYSAASAPVAALFAIMTKVGVYAIVRVYTLIFGAGGGVAADVASPWLLPIALLTIVLGMVGAARQPRAARMQGYLLIGSVGVMLAPIALFDARAISAGLYYLVHSTLDHGGHVPARDLIAQQRGEGRSARARRPLQPAGAARHALLHRRRRRGGSAAAVRLRRQGADPDATAPQTPAMDLGDRSGQRPARAAGAQPRRHRAVLGWWTPTSARRRRRGAPAAFGPTAGLLRWSWRSRSRRPAHRVHGRDRAPAA